MEAGPLSVLHYIQNKAIFYLQSSAIIFRVSVHVMNQCYTAIIDCALFKANPSVALLKVSVFHLSIIVHCFQYRILSLLDNFIEQIFQTRKTLHGFVGLFLREEQDQQAIEFLNTTV